MNRLLNDLPRRAALTVRTHGWPTLISRVLTAPLRPFGRDYAVQSRIERRRDLRAAIREYRAAPRPVLVVVPTYGDPAVTLATVEGVRRTTDTEHVRIVVVDDASEAHHADALRTALKDALLEVAPENAGYSAAVNRGIALAAPGEDVVVLNNDVTPHRGWLAELQLAAYEDDAVGIVGPRLLYPDGRIQSAGTYRNMGAPEWFDHRYRFRPANHGPASVPTDALAMTGACLYVRRDLIDQLGPWDEEYPMGYEDVDYCLRAWEAGRAVRYEPHAELTHLESPTRGAGVGERELASQRHFWERWGGWFDDRPVRTADGALRVIYVTLGTGVGGGHRDIFEHLNRLAERGHDVALYCLEDAPEWFPLKAPVHTFEDYDALTAAMARQDAIKVATWWATGWPVWRASLQRGRPVFFVQDIETSYYDGRSLAQHRARDEVLASYREEFRYMTIADVSVQKLAAMGLSAELVPPGIDLGTFRQLDGVERRDDMVLALGRAQPLKNFPLTVAAWERLDPRPELCLFGVEPEVTPKGRARYVERPSDEGVNELFNQAAAFVQTSVHEGFCLPPLEAMAAGTPVVCTDANGNRDFCVDGENCLMVESDPASVARGLERVLGDEALRAKLVAGGLATVGDYAWDRRIDELERFLNGVADERPEVSGARPGPRVADRG